MGEKRFLVTASARSERGFFRCGKYWEGAGSTHEVGAADVERLKAEYNIVVQSVIEAGAAVADEPDTAAETPAAKKPAKK